MRSRSVPRFDARWSAWVAISLVSWSGPKGLAIIGRGDQEFHLHCKQRLTVGRWGPWLKSWSLAIRPPGHILKPLSRLAICLHCQRLDQSHWLRSGEVDDALEMEEKTEAAAVEARPLLAAIKTGYLPLSKKSRRSMVKPIYRGGCLCGAVRFEADGPALNPHNCSCEFCQRHTGSLTASWVEFAATDVRWVGSSGSPSVYRSSDFSSCAFCPECGSSIGAIDDAPTVALLIGTFDDHCSPELKPDYHSFKPEKPVWG